jgi:hypothetical protein
LASQRTARTHPQYVGVWGPLLLLFTSQYVVLLVVPVPVVETAVELTVMGHTAHTGLVAAGAARASEAERRTRKAESIVRVGVVVIEVGSARLLRLSLSASALLCVLQDRVRVLECRLRRTEHDTLHRLLCVRRTCRYRP